MTKDEALKKVRQMSLPEETKEILEALVPELAESEDERIRKAIVELIHRTPSSAFESNAEFGFVGATHDEMLSYLEKQKEQNGEDGFLEDELSAFLQNYDKEYDDDAAVSDVARHFYEIGKKQEEQKQAQTSEEKEYVRTIKSIISDFIRDKKPENLAYYQRIYDWLDGRHVPFSCGHENGKPADCVFSKQEYESHPIISTDTTSTKPVEFDGKTLLYTADKSYQIGFRDGVASVKPAEWGEEDEDMLNSCISSIEEAKENRYAYKETDGDTSYDHEIAWLKALRPSWKPNEEQMKALDKARRFIPYNCDALESLYNDLKKLT